MKLPQNGALSPALYPILTDLLVMGKCLEIWFQNILDYICLGGFFFFLRLKLDLMPFVSWTLWQAVVRCYRQLFSILILKKAVEDRRLSKTFSCQHWDTDTEALSESTSHPHPVGAKPYFSFPPAIPLCQPGELPREQSTWRKPFCLSAVLFLFFSIL